MDIICLQEYKLQSDVVTNYENSFSLVFISYGS
jgi:exonuclease III